LREESPPSGKKEQGRSARRRFGGAAPAIRRQPAAAYISAHPRILLHLAGKVERSMVSYRPTAKPRSILDLLEYLAIIRLPHAAVPVISKPAAERS
jgi:hypothetical protein